MGLYGALHNGAKKKKSIKEPQRETPYGFLAQSPHHRIAIISRIKLQFARSLSSDCTETIQTFEQLGFLRVTHRYAS
jgi:hypothetical protein